MNLEGRDLDWSDYMVQNLLKKYPVVISLASVCLLFAIASSFYEGMYDLFAFHSKPVYIWHYISGTFMHGSKDAPLWFLWVHLFMNYLMIIPFGCILEAKTGSKNTCIVFIAAMLLSSVAFQALLYGQDELACGISAVGYAFVTGGIVNMRDLWKTYSSGIRILYFILCVLAVIMLSPMITGWISTCLHLSGMISYFAVYPITKSFKTKRQC